MLTFSTHNSKLKLLAKYLKLPQNQVVSFDIPAGWTCPKADICKTFTIRETGKQKRVGRVLCYASKAELYAPNCRIMRWRNFDQLRACKGNHNKMFTLLLDSLPTNAKVVRIHSSGDFFSKSYFLAWAGLAVAFPDISFYGYTKILDYVISPLPDNFYLHYSYGSKDDKRWNPEIPTCFIKEREGQYPEYSVICNGEGTEHEDYFHILARKSFVIPAH